ncbi:hypothetical protein E8D34_15935 [Nocardioides sp. GY 10113]|uniref:hypothetical protein n=1 Tax=Nocardioides sp. GY 10113 TaxID=2569761 RepID=UPI0010A795DC|nr:hypothetical protein [Nocardioides sp. GY 10113]TIC83612.1 hypothetical protein E8D34_15935 [Nocardioides sp. GY 10113]
MDEIRSLAREAINNRLEGTGHEMSRCLIGMWAEPDGVLVLHVNSGGNSIAVTHALWSRFKVDSAPHPEYGVLIWVR